MQPLLTELADIRTGLTLRGPDATRRIDEEGLHLLRISDISETGQILSEDPLRLERSLVDDSRYRVQPHDVLIANRGARMTAALVPPGMEATASGQLFIVRLKSNTVTAPYLHWFLNLTSTQERMRSEARGSYVKTLSISVVKKLEIPVPSLEQQQKICELAALVDRERQLVSRLAEQHQRLTEGTFQHILKNITS